MNNEENNNLPTGVTDNNDFYHDDNSFNNQGLENSDSTDESQSSNRQPNFNNGGNNLMEGLKNRKDIGNHKNNPALGRKIPQKKDDKKSENNNKSNQEKPENKSNNPLPGGGTNKKADDKKPQAKKDDKKPENSIKNNSLAKKNSPFNRLGLNNKSKKSTSTSKKATEAGTEKLKQASKQGIKKLWTVLPIQAKIAVAVGVPLLVILGVLIMAFMGGTTAAVTAAMCGESSYDTGNKDATAFMCSMVDPVKDSKYTVTDLFGWRDFNSGFHTGIDLAGAAGTPILSVQGGEVSFAGTSGGYGNLVIVKHGEEFLTYYAHLSSITVTKGQKVKQGEEVGKRGTTGHSTGNHLHFEITDSKNNKISPNPFFKYSDQGYDKCLNKNGSYDSRCDLNSSGNARFLGKEGFNQICGKTGNYTSDSNGDCCGTTTGNGTIVEFIKKFEGSGGYCDSSKTKYKAYQNSGDRVTIGYGVTSDYIPGLKLGDCMDVAVVDAAKEKAIESKRKTIKSKFTGTNLTSYQEDALTSMAYNGCGTYFTSIANAVKQDNYEKIWKEMKGCTNGGMLGLERRRKAEFALFVTGDYNSASEYKTKNWTTAEYNNYDSDDIMAKKASGTSSECTSETGDKAAVVKRAQEEYENWNSSKQYCNNIKKYLASCGYNGGKGGLDNYCAGFVTYILKEAGVNDQIGLPGYTCFPTSFEKTKNGKIHKAGGSYIPQPGDIMIVRGKGHIVLVEKVVGKRVHYIGGNEGGSGYCGFGKVNKGSYALNDSYITEYISY